LVKINLAGIVVTFEQEANMKIADLSNDFLAAIQHYAPGI
jgi:hypothetical protein